MNCRMFACLAVVSLVLRENAAAQNGTWTNDADGLWSDGQNWDVGVVAAGAGNTANFSLADITADRTVTLDVGQTVGQLAFGDTDTSSSAGWTLHRTEDNALILSGGAITVNPLGAGRSVTISVALGGSSDITIRGGGVLVLTETNTMTGAMNIGTADDGNNVTFSAAGFAVPSPGKSLTVGNGFKNNRVTVAAGCTLRYRAGNTVGLNSGGDNNVLTVTGSGAQVIIDNNGGSQFNLGQSGGKANHVEVSNGGYLKTQKFVIGRSGGTDNSARITGTNSLVLVGNGNQGCLNVGTDNGGTARNGIIIDDGGYLLYDSPAYKSGGSIGDSSGADDNYILVKADSTFLFQHSSPNSLPFVLGAYNGRDGSTYQDFPIDSTASGNHLDIVSGGRFITTHASVYLMGVNSTMNLGDGTGISQATIGATAAIYNLALYSPGIVLYKSDSRLNFNSGRLTAGAAGQMISGPGEVSNAGPAYISTTYTDSSIDSTIVGSGSLTKEGSGTLTISAFNTYTGDTIVTNGMLAINHPYLSNAGDVHLAKGSTLKLNFAGEDVIGGLYHDGIVQPQGVYGTGDLDGAIGGTMGGHLRVTKGPAQSGFSLIVR